MNNELLEMLTSLLLVIIDWWLVFMSFETLNNLTSLSCDIGYTQGVLYTAIN